MLMMKYRNTPISRVHRLSIPHFVARMKENKYISCAMLLHTQIISNIYQSSNEFWVTSKVIIFMYITQFSQIINFANKGLSLERVHDNSSCINSCLSVELWLINIVRLNIESTYKTFSIILHQAKMSSQSLHQKCLHSII